MELQLRLDTLLGVDDALSKTKETLQQTVTEREQYRLAMEESEELAIQQQAALRDAAQSIKASGAEITRLTNVLREREAELKATRIDLNDALTLINSFRVPR